MDSQYLLQKSEVDGFFFQTFLTALKDYVNLANDVCHISTAYNTF